MPTTNNQQPAFSTPQNPRRVIGWFSVIGNGSWLAARLPLLPVTSNQQLAAAEALT
jgi:hypothetical protein